MMKVGVLHGKNIQQHNPLSASFSLSLSLPLRITRSRHRTSNPILRQAFSVRSKTTFLFSPTRSYTSFTGVSPVVVLDEFNVSVAHRAVTISERLYFPYKYIYWFSFLIIDFFFNTVIIPTIGHERSIRLKYFSASRNRARSNEPIKLGIIRRGLPISA